ncbi:MAG: lysine--tRNA ligase [Clostridiales bacterium]|jgi:lysyl-tRNA synthetase class 2|nr:lysine--tRNA ligase [Clostridiales bacterium]
MEETQENLNDLLRVRREKLAELASAGKNPFARTKYPVTHHSRQIKENFEAMEGLEAAIAGRVMSKRVMGKASFCDIEDREGRLQVYVSKTDIGEESYADFKKFDVGDIAGVRGVVFRTKMGEISIHACEIILLSKSLQIFPEKFHGLKDTEIRYRQRYLDLIVNPEVRDTFLKRSAIIKSIRGTLDALGYIEVETPVLQTVAGGAAARPFNTHHNAHGLDMHLRISLELPLKRLIVGGMERVYEIGRVFRNEGVSIRHNPEFTLLELYEAYTDYHGMMDLCEKIIRNAALEVLGTTEVLYSGVAMDLGKPFERLTMLEAVNKYSGEDFSRIPDGEAARARAKERGVETEEYYSKGDVLNAFFEKFAEEHLLQPTFIMDYPVEISPLTKRKPDDPDYTERFELFIAAREHANAYSELNDPIDQLERFRHQEKLLALGNFEANEIDEDFILAMEYGMPPTGGMGIGIERLVMLLTDSASIRDVLLFPTMKPL